MLHAITTIKQTKAETVTEPHLRPGDCCVSRARSSDLKLVGMISLCLVGFPLLSTKANASPGASIGPSTVVAGLSNPQSIAVDANGNLYIGDQGCINFVGALGDCNVYKETLSGGTYTQSIIASFSASNPPQGIAVDSSGNVFITVLGLGVMKEAPSGGGKYTQTAIGCAFDAPGGIAVDGQGTLYVTNRSGSRVNKETPTDTCSTMGLVASGLSAPTGLALDASSSVYVIQTGAPGTVVKETASGNGYSAATVAGGGNFNGVAVDTKGNVFLTSGNGDLYEYSPPSINSVNYSYLTLAIGFAVPAGVAADTNGNVYVVNTGYNQVVKIPVATANAQRRRKPFVIPSSRNH
jgi:streptogramin lyase